MPIDMRSTRSFSSSRKAITAATRTGSMSTALVCWGTEHKVATRSLTCKEPGGDSGRKRSLGAAVDAGEELEEQPVFCHGVDHAGHGKHGAQQAAVGRESSGLAGWWPDKPSRLQPPSREGKDRLVLGAGQELHRADALLSWDTCPQPHGGTGGTTDGAGPTWWRARRASRQQRRSGRAPSPLP